MAPSTTDESPFQPPHVVIFPYFAQGHTIPLIHLSKELSRRGLKATIISTPANAPFILSHISNYQPSISLSIIPFPKSPDLPEGCENVASVPSPSLFLSFYAATKRLKQPFEDVLRDMIRNGCRPICVISGFFLGWTVDSCRLFDIPRIVTHTMGVLPVITLKLQAMQMPCISAAVAAATSSDPEIPLQLSGFKLPFALNEADFLEFALKGDRDDPIYRIILESSEADGKSSGVLANSFEEIEGEYAAAMEALHPQKLKSWLVGPVQLYDHEKNSEPYVNNNGSCPYMKWLDDKPGGSLSGGVMYVAFGTQAHLTDRQLDEIAYGLEMAGYPFIWVVRSKTWVPPDGWLETVTKDQKGLVVRSWLDQRSILSHPAIGGFLSHCGWNAILESLTNGLPLLTWSMDAEQPINAKFVSLVLGIGFQLCVGGNNKSLKFIDRFAIRDGVKELMGGEKGKKAREKAQALAKMARQAVEKGGSSFKNLDQFIECLVNNQN